MLGTVQEVAVIFQQTATNVQQQNEYKNYRRRSLWILRIIRKLK